MKRSHACARAVAIAAGLVWANLADAKDLRFPEHGDASFVLHIPDRWTTKPDSGGNLILAAPDHFAAVSLSLVEDKSYAVAPLDEEARKFAKAA